MNYGYEDNAENVIKGKVCCWVVLALNEKKWWTFCSSPEISDSVNE
jgi:hypothetical protein